MKKTLALLLIAVLCLSALTACGNKTEEPAPQMSAGMPNPVQEMTKDELAAATGFVLDAPRGAENVRYQTIDGDPVIAEMDFSLNGADYCYRVQDAGDQLESYDMAGLYYDWTDVTEGEVAYCPAKVSTCAEAGFVQWMDVVPGLNYNLSSTSETGAAALLALANDLFVPVQGDADGEAPEDDAGSYLAGSYTDPETGNSIAFEIQEDGSYTVDLGLTRLASMEGLGQLVGNSVEMTLTDPNGGSMDATFFPEPDGSYSLRITVSDWDLLESSTLFDGFFAE